MIIKGITAIPGKRSQKYVEYDNGYIERRCMAPHNPHFFINEDGLMLPINIGMLTLAENSKVGSYLHRGQNVVSVGIRHDNDPFKYLGLRPDINQVNGAEQLEFSLQRIIFDGVEQSFDLSQNNIVNAIVTDLGSIQVFSNRQRTRQMVKVNRPISSFRIEFIIHLKGLRIEYRADLNEYWIFSTSTGGFRYRIRAPYLIDAATYEPLSIGEYPDIRIPQLTHDLADNGDGTYTYVKENGEDFSALVLPELYLIDADIYYAGTSDGTITYANASWATCRGASTGSATYINGSYADSTTNHSFGAYLYGNYYLWRSFFMFDTSAAGSVSACSLNLYPYHGTYHVDGDICVLQGTQGDALNNADFGAITGSEFGHVSWNSGAGVYIELPFNAAGISGVNTDGTTYVAAIDYSHDYSNEAPTGYDAYEQCFYANNTGTDKDPYLSITEGVGGGLSIPVVMHHLNQLRNA